MHPDAEAYDIEHGVRHPTKGLAYKHNHIPINRPCDWCGKIVEKHGCNIHTECVKLEFEMYAKLLKDKE